MKTKFLLIAQCTQFFLASYAYAQNSNYGKSLLTMAQSLLDDLGGTNGPFIRFFLGFCMVMGIILGIVGVIGLTKRDTPKSGAIVTIIIGAMLISLPQVISTINMSLFDDASNYSILSSQVSGGDNQVTQATKMFINFSIFIIQVVGFLALYRGLKTISDISLTHQRQPDQMRTAIIFIVAGVACINILWTLRIVCGTLGPEAVRYYGKIFSHISSAPK